MTMNHQGGRIRPVILAGGAGTRLWPMSTPAKPKHLLPLIGDSSLFEQTLARFADPALFGPPIIVANHAQADELTGLLRHVAGAQLILEPMKRDSAPAIALAAIVADPDDILLMSPSDHHIADLPAFLAAIEAGRPAAEAGDFSEFKNEAAVRASIVIQGSDQATDNSGSPLARQLAGESVDDARAYQLVLPEVERVLTRTDDYEPLWLSAWDKIAKAIESFERGNSTATEFSEAGLSLITLAPRATARSWAPPIPPTPRPTISGC